MFKTVSLYALAILLSLSILGPSFLALLENEAEIEIVQDLEEEKKETKKELEEYEKFFSDLPTFSIEIVENRDLSGHHYLVSPYGHTRDINPPPPDVT